MLPFEDRYTRQRQVPEVGLDGQQRIEASDAALAAGPGSLVATIYLHRAGVCRVEVSTHLPAASRRHAAFFQFAGPADVAAGCELAMSHLRRQLPALKDSTSAVGSLK